MTSDITTEARERNYYYRHDSEGRLTLEITTEKSMLECIELTAICMRNFDRKNPYKVGEVVGNYKIAERFRRIGKNTKYKVVCTLCQAPMFRYSNKFKLPHRGCPAIQGNPPMKLKAQPLNKRSDV